jgi:hypothetical protein
MSRKRRRPFALCGNLHLHRTSPVARCHHVSSCALPFPRYLAAISITLSESSSVTFRGREVFRSVGRINSEHNDTIPLMGGERGSTARGGLAGEICCIGPPVVAEETALSSALHAYPCFLAQPGGALVRIEAFKNWKSQSGSSSPSTTSNQNHSAGQNLQIRHWPPSLDSPLPLSMPNQSRLLLEINDSIH